jgi:hypothetical protein
MRVINFFIGERCGFKWLSTYIVFITLAYWIGGICILALTECYNAAYDLGVLSYGMNIYLQIYIPLVKVYSASFFVFAAFLIVAIASDVYIESQRKYDMQYEMWIPHTYSPTDSSLMKINLLFDLSVNPESIPYPLRINDSMFGNDNSIDVINTDILDW